MLVFDWSIDCCSPLDGLEDTPLTIFNMPTASPQKKRSNVPQERTMYHSMVSRRIVDEHKID